MNENDPDLVFPQRLLPVLVGQRGPIWQELVEQARKREPTDPEAIAFILLVARLANCTTCHMDALRALRGCAQCARQAVTRFRGNDQDLVGLYSQACLEIKQYVNNGVL